MANYRIKRIYEDASADDGLRVLVDRLWPRGVSKERAALDHWLKEIAPSHELRKWFHEQEPPFGAFAERYRDELEGNQAVAELWALAAGAEVVTLLYASKDEEGNHAVVLKTVMEAEE